MAVMDASLPPGPRLPRWAQTLGFMFFNARFMDGSRRRYGDVVTFRTLFDARFVVVFDPATTRELFRGSPERLRAGEANALLGPLVGARSLLLLDGAEHLRHRRLILPPFHGERMRAYEDVMRAATDREVDGWPDDEPFALLPAMQAITLDVILRAVFGVVDEQRRGRLHDAIRALLDPVGDRRTMVMMFLARGRLAADARRAFAERRATVDALLAEEIERRRGAPDLDEREDVLSLLLLARDDDGEGLTDAELSDELKTLLVAGHETTATALAWAFERLLSTPDVLDRLRASLAAGERDYLDAVVKETLRARTVVPGIGRVVREVPHAVGGHDVPLGMEINPSLAGIHRDARHHPEPGAFRPERFLGARAEADHAWVPFGGGTRRCPGASFATFEMAVVIGRVLERCDLRPAWDRPERSLRKGVVFVPRDGVLVRVESLRDSLGSSLRELPGR